MSCFLNAMDHEGSFCVERDLPVVVSIEGVDLSAAIVLTAGCCSWGGDDGDIDASIQGFIGGMVSDDDPTQALALPYLQLRQPDSFSYFTVRFSGDVALTGVRLPARAHVRAADEDAYGVLLALVTAKPGNFVGRVAAVDLVGIAQLCGPKGAEVRAVFVEVANTRDGCSLEHRRVA